MADMYCGLKLGAFLMPSHPPERSVLEGHRWDLEELQRLDRLGFSEAWIGEHFTAAWEPCPAPDLLIAQALPLTQDIRLGPLGQERTAILDGALGRAARGPG